MNQEEKMILAVPEKDETYSNRPRRTPDKSIKGKLQVWEEEGQYAFSARVAHPELKQEVLHDRGGVKLTKTPGKKESSYILKALVPGDSPDPEGQLLSKVYEQLASKAKKAPKVNTTNFLLNEEGHIQVWQNKKQKRLCVFVSLDTSVNKELIYNEFSELQTKLYKIISSTKF